MQRVTNMSISVIIPTRNAEWCLPYALQSLERQTTPPTEILVCVGKSNDKTEDVVLKFQEASKTPVRIIYDREGIGTSHALNNLVRLAETEWVVWVSSDFVLPRNWIECVVHLINSNDVDVLDGYQVQINPEDMKTSIAPEIDRESLVVTPLTTQQLYDSVAPLISKREKILDVGGYDTYFTRGVDADILIRLYHSGAKLMRCKNLKYFHAGLKGKRNIHKGLVRSTFLRFYFYKYGWRYILSNPHHFVGALLRMSSVLFLLLSIFSLPFSKLLVIVSGSLFLLSFTGILVGLKLTYGEIGPSLITLQGVKAIGEYYQLYKLLVDRNKPKFGYGKKWLIRKEDKPSGMKITLTGNPIDVRFLSEKLKEAGVTFTTIRHNFGSLIEKFMKVLGSDLVHIVSVKPNGVEGICWICILSFLRLMRKKVILHWMGTDVLELTPIMSYGFSRLVSKHLAFSPWLVDELNEKGIESVWLPLLCPLNPSYKPLPKEFTVLVYLGATGHTTDFYGNKALREIVRAMSDAKFLVLGNVPEEVKINSPNVQYFGVVEYEEMDGLHNKSAVLLRQTKHDGLPYMVLEALVRGRYVIWTYSFPHCYPAKDSSEAIGWLKELEKTDEINMGGVEFIKDQLNSKMWFERLIQTYEEVLK